MGLLELIWLFLKVGAMAFGGGWTVVGLIKMEAVPRLMSESDFASMVAIAQATPGPLALNAATLLGFRSSGFIGAVLATLAVIAFPTAAIAAAGAVGRRLKLNTEALDQSLKTGTLAMMLMTLWFLLPKGGINLIITAIGLVSFALCAFTKLNPLWLIFGAAFLNMALKLLNLS